VSDTQTIATFTGILLRRQHMPGQKLVQLVFREDDRNWLCVSSKLNYAALQVGQKYHIEGEFKYRGDKSYIHEPVVSRAKTAKRGRSRKLLFIASGAIASLVIVGGSVFALHGGHSNATDLQAANTSVKATAQAVTTPVRTEPTPPQTTTSTATTPPVPITKPTTTKPTTKKTTTVTAPVVTAPTVTPSVSTAYCDAAVAIPVTYTDQVDSTVDPGTVIDAGTPGSQQTCYDDASGANPHLVVLTAMTPGTRAVAPPLQ
jgi:cytoskeletal protein RodZ